MTLCISFHTNSLVRLFAADFHKYSHLAFISRGGRIYRFHSAMHLGSSYSRCHSIKFLVVNWCFSALVILARCCCANFIMILYHRGRLFGSPWGLRLDLYHVHSVFSARPVQYRPYWTHALSFSWSVIALIHFAVFAFATNCRSGIPSSPN